VRLKHPIEVYGQPVTEITLRRHDLRMGDLRALQAYARRAGLGSDIGELIESGDLGAMMVLLERWYGLPEGTTDLMHPDDFAAAMQEVTPFLGASPTAPTGS
jgi:hypothetical protein